MYTSKRVKLREYRESDIQRALSFVNDYEVKKYLTQDIPFPTTLKEEKEFVINSKSYNGAYNFAIEDIESKKYIGGCGINKVDFHNRYCIIGIMIGDGNYRDKGYGTEIINLLLDFIFNEMNLNKALLTTYSFNKRGIKCYEKCGFKIEGVSREELFREGKYHDIIHMGILKSEWEQKK